MTSKINEIKTILYETPKNIVSTTTGLFPIYRLLQMKTCQQRGTTSYPVFSLMPYCTDVVKGGALIGLQVTIQKVIECALGFGDKPSLPQMIGSSFLVGGISAPILAAFNAQTGSQTWWHALRHLSFPQVQAVCFREICFLFAIRASDPFSKAVAAKWGDQKVMEYGSAAAVGALGSLLSHPADTWLTCLQNERAFTFKASLLGWQPRMIGIAGFIIMLKATQDLTQKS